MFEFTANIPRPSWRFLQCLGVATVLLIATVLYTWQFSTSNPIRLSVPQAEFKPHPIDALITSGQTAFNTTLANEARDLKGAAEAYRKRRGRHPPPGFDAWFKFSQEKEAIIVEDFFDQIYHDLEPFWGVPAQQIRDDAQSIEHLVTVRKGKATQRTDHQREWMDLWHDMVRTIEAYLPDVDMPINTMDESRLLVPWEEINRTVSAANKSMTFPRDVLQEFSELPSLSNSPKFDPEWWVSGQPYWPLARAGCDPNSRARQMEIISEVFVPSENGKNSPQDLLPTKYPVNSYHGYVWNWTMTTDPCVHPHLQGLHGTFVEPISMSTSKRLFPMFGGSKLPMNNEILIPPAMYWSDRELYSGGESHGIPWSQKHNKIIWRGAATGGRNKKETWPRFQRHRFLSMVNGTQVTLAEHHNATIPSMSLPPPQLYHVEAAEEGRLGEWIGNFSDAAFYDMVCFPNEGGPSCSYTNEYYAVGPMMPMKEQYAYKYLPDIDGNSFSGRYRGFLRSTSLPVKATIYREWHDSRLFPWVHFVPMDNTFVDFYGIMEYFIGSPSGGRPAHDEAAQKIAEAGQWWAEKVLRREDMQIYVYRLLLEYARVCDEKRDKMGFVGDLIR